MKKKILALLIVAATSSLFGCGQDALNKGTLTQNYIDYSNSGEKVFYTSAGTEYVIDTLEKEATEFEPNVVYSLYIGNTAPDQKVYNWCTMPIEERKADLKECGDMVVEFAKSEEWDNDYCLYININQIYNGQDLVYNYETDSLYVPTTESIFMEMYEQFGTMHTKDLEEIDGGIDFLVNNNLAYLKHDEIEYKTPSPSGVRIYEGEFDSFIDGYSVY